MPSDSVKNTVLSTPLIRPVAPASAWLIERIQRMACQNDIRGLARLSWMGRRLLLGTGVRAMRSYERF